MILNFLTKVFGSKNERELKRLAPLVEQINALEPEIQAMSDETLRAQTLRFKERLENGEPLDDLLPEAFATVREASVRTLEMRHFDVQLIGGIILHQGKIAEMKTGEGKTLVATLPAYLNALTGSGGDQGFAFTGLHFCDLALMQHNSADQLHIKMTHFQSAHRSFSNRCKRFGNQIIQRLSVFETFFESGRLGPEGFIAHGLNLRLQFVDPCNQGC